ncbi:MAG: HU family DNA-binding protein [Deltaproteobacteria bacterium]|nr:HU family DNA-binding protein [Deltaproteobacteria bacterium]
MKTILLKTCILLSLSAFCALIVSDAYAASNDGVIARMTTKNGISDAQARDQFNLVLDSIKEELKAGGQVSLSGLGKLSITERAERMGRNPRSGKQLKIPARRYVHFSSSDTFKKELNPNALKSVEVEESEVPSPEALVVTK